MSTSPPKLSRREREVARLVAEGLTSKEIGQRLFISERTAEGHVEQIRNKLGFRSRSQIAAWVASEAASPTPAPPTPPAGAPRTGRVGVLPASHSLLWVLGVAMLLAALLIVNLTGLFRPASTADVGPHIDTFAGTGLSSLSPDGRLARSTGLVAPNGLVISRSGEIYVADGDRIRVVRNDGRVYTVAGTLAGGFTAEQGHALTSMLNISSPGAAETTGLALDAKGDLFVSDTGNDRVREITPDGDLVTVAGARLPPGHSYRIPTPADVGDGRRAIDAVLTQPRGLAFDGLGNLFIADTGDNRVRKLDTSGIITTVAGTGVLGSTGDGGPAEHAELSAPEGLAFDAQGDLYISDTGNERIRKVAGGVITTVAGNGSSGFSGDGGRGTRAMLNLPLGLATDSRGNLYVADAANFRVRRVDLSGTITTVAGNGGEGYAGDTHAATAATLNLPVALAIGSLDDLYIADSGNNRIRLVRLGGA